MSDCLVVYKSQAVGKSDTLMNCVAPKAKVDCLVCCFNLNEKLTSPSQCQTKRYF